MLLNYYTLLKLKEEFQELIGLEISSVFSQDKDSIIIDIMSEEEYYIDFSSDNKYSSCFISQGFRRAGKNTIDLFPDLVGEIIQNVSLSQFDRILKIELINSNLYLVLFGRGSSNIILTKKDDTIIDSLEDSKTLINTEFAPKNNILELDNDSTINDNLSKLPFIMGNKISKEFLYRYSLDPNIKVSELDFNLIDKVNEFIDNMLDDDNYIYNINNQITLSPLELSYLNISPEKIFTSISDAIKWKKVNSLNNERFNEETKGISKKIYLEIKKAKSRYENAENYISLLELADNYRLYADLLMSYPEPKSKKGKEIELQDWSGNDLKIKLDEKLNILDNASKYYSKAKKTEKDAVLKEKEIPELKNKLYLYQKIKNEFDSCKSLKEIKNFKLKFASELNLKINKKMEEESKFRHFNFENYDIYVGKSAANNDELTVKFAKPNDIWLHARGVPGSHTIIRVTNKDKVKKEVIEFAAALAAYYSQSRKASLVPVIYTEKKYVRKPKGANPGSVLVQKENVTMVKPKSPEELS